MTSARFVWLDIETTGLDASKDRMLELGFIVTDADLRAVADVSWTIGPAPDLGYMHADVVAMHSNSGLFTDVARHGISMETVNRRALDWLRDEAQVPQGLPMCGSSVHFDRAFLARHLPNVHDFFGYRNIDVSTLKELVHAWDEHAYAARPRDGKTHRVLADIHDSIAELRYYREWMRP